MRIPEKSFPFYLLVLAHFLFFSALRLFTDGMFVDGLVYATVSRNMAEGLGTFWAPHFSDTFFHGGFFEHPPLALWLQSLFFGLLGDALLVERLYSLCALAATGIVIHLIWAEITGDGKTSYLPLFFWLLARGVIWTYSNNLLENTLVIFVSLSVLFYFKSRADFRFLFLILAGVMSMLGILTKGFTGLFVWALPLWCFLVSADRPARVISDTAVLVAATLLPLAALWWLSPAAAESLSKYFNDQVVDSIQNESAVANRAYILRKFLEAILPVVVAAALCVFAGRRMQAPGVDWKRALPLFCLTLSGVVPIMISLKQRPFYIHCVYPFFALAVGILLFPVVRSLLERIDPRGRGFRQFRWCAWVLVAAGLVLTALYWGRPTRDQELLSDVRAICEIVAPGTTAGMSREIVAPVKNAAYFARYGRVELDRKDLDREFYIAPLRESAPPDGFVDSGAQTARLKLFRKADAPGSGSRQ